jgi:hypothetical protein
MRTVRRVVEHTTGSAEDRRYQVLLWQMLGFHFWHRIFIESESVDAAKLQVEALVA